MAKARRRGIAAEPMASTFGNWNEKSLLPVGWIFSIWLRLKYPPTSTVASKSLEFQPQSIAVSDAAELAEGNQKTVIISDFAVVPRKSSDSKRRFVSAEIKYSNERTIAQLTAAISSQLEQKDETIAPPGLSADHTLIFLTSPGIKNRSSLAGIENSISGNRVLKECGFSIPESFEEACVASLYVENTAGAIYRLKREVKNGKTAEKYCWIWVSHYSLISVMLANVILGTSATAKTTADTARLLLSPVLEKMDANLLSVFEPVDLKPGSESRYSSPLSEGLKDLLVQPLQPLASLEQFLVEPMVFLTHLYLDACRASAATLADEKGGFTWNRLLYRIAKRDIRRGANRSIENWNRNTIPPMPLRIVERNQSGVYQAESVHVVLQALRSPRIAVLEGHSGSGKSTLLEFLHLTWLDSLQHAGSLSGQTELPLFLRLQLLTPEQIEKLDTPEILPDIFHLPAAAMAILKTSPVCLVIDAFDQIADNDDSVSKFHSLAELLQAQGFVISRIIISSRPLFRADLAMRKWSPLLRVAEEGEGEQQVRVFQLMPPNEAARNAFLRKWLGFLSDVSIRRKSQLTVDAFSNWLRGLNSKDDETGSLMFGEESILASPLLLSLALYVFVAKHNLVCDIKSTADLFNAVVETAADNSSQLETDRTGSWSESIERICNVSWGHIANPENILGNMFSSDVLWYSTAAQNRGGKGRRRIHLENALRIEEFDAVNDFPFLVVRRNREAIEFVHPSFQEYFAARWLVDEFFGSGGLPSVTGANAQPGQAGSGMYEGRLGAFAESCLRLGREGFRLLLGCLYRRMRSSEGDAGRGKVEDFLNAIHDEHCFQQYLYDAGFLDEAIVELKLLGTAIDNKYDGNADANAKRVLQKLIAHAFYGRNDAHEKRICRDDLLHIVDTEAVDSWMKLFAMDHVWNRWKAEENLEDLTRKKIESFPSEFREAENRYKLNADTWRAIVIPTTAFQVTLRFGHYFGHQGNHTLQSPNPKDWDEGIDHFSRAILFRVVDARLTLTDPSFAKLSAVATDLNKNSWYRSWISEPHRNGTTKFEGFVGPSQAFGDTAQQYCARSHLYLNKFVHIGKRRTADLNHAKSDQNRATSLWHLALEPDGIDCSGGLKYFVYTVALAVRVQMIDDWNNGDLGDLLHYRKKTQRDLEEAESKIGFHYQQSRGIDGMIKSWHQQLSSAGQ